MAAREHYGGTMSEAQREALRRMSERRIGALITRFGWTWPQHVRDSEDAALAVLEALDNPMPRGTGLRVLRTLGE